MVAWAGAGVGHRLKWRTGWTVTRAFATGTTRRAAKLASDNGEGRREALDGDWDAVFAAISNGDTDLSADQLAALSDLDSDRRHRLTAALRQLDASARFAFLDRLLAAADEVLLLDFTAVCLECVQDADPTVRALASSGLANDEGRDALPVLLRLARTDPDERVRSEAALALAPFALRAELGELPGADRDLVVRTLRDAVTDVAEEPHVQAGALASLGAISEPWVQELIFDAYESGDAALRLGAVEAMGRSADDYWLPTVINVMASADEDERIAAAGAAGEIGDEDALVPVAELLEDDSIDVVLVAARALGDIGGAAAMERLEPFSTHPDANVRAVVQAALEEARYADDPLGMSRKR